MALVKAPLRATQVASVGGQKRFAVVRDSQASVNTVGRDELFRVKFNPDWSEGLTPGVAAAAATVEIDATNIILDVDGALDRNIAHAGLTVQQMIDAINATESDNTNRWRAGLADAAPNVVATPAVMAAQDVMQGYIDSVAVSHTPIEVVFIGVGSDRSNRGEGDFLPDGFNTLYDYPLDPAANPGDVGRTGGIDAGQGEDVLSQRRSAFRKSPAQLAQERHPSQALFLTTVDAITTNIAVPDGANPDVPILAQIFDGSGTLVWSQLGSATPPVYFAPPGVTVRGPAYVTVGGNGTEIGDGAITTGIVTVEGFTRKA